MKSIGLLLNTLTIVSLLVFCAHAQEQEEQQIWVPIKVLFVIDTFDVQGQEVNKLLATDLSKLTPESRRVKDVFAASSDSIVLNPEEKQTTRIGVATDKYGDLYDMNMQVADKHGVQTLASLEANEVGEDLVLSTRISGRNKLLWIRSVSNRYSADGQTSDALSSLDLKRKLVMKMPTQQHFKRDKLFDKNKHLIRLHREYQQRHADSSDKKLRNDHYYITNNSDRLIRGILKTNNTSRPSSSSRNINYIEFYVLPGKSFYMSGWDSWSSLELVSAHYLTEEDSELLYSLNK